MLRAVNNRFSTALRYTNYLLVEITSHYDSQISKHSPVERQDYMFK